MVKLVDNEIKALFPLKTIQSIEELFLSEIRKSDPNLALLSVILGAIEHSLTRVTPRSGGDSPQFPATKVKNVKFGRSRIKSSKSDILKPASLRNENELNGKHCSTKPGNNDKLGEPDNCESELPLLELETVETLYSQFQWMIVGSVDLNALAKDNKESFQIDENIQTPHRRGKRNGRNAVEEKGQIFLSEFETTRKLVEKVSEVVWGNLSTTYGADKPHLQTLFTYLTGKKLDSFGVALAVVAGCQILGLKDVHLALSEDHAWVYFGENGRLTAEVTWHGKGQSDKRGEPVSLVGADASAWLYLKGFHLNCDRHMEAAAIVAAMNPIINHTADSLEMGIIQKRLLWILYDSGHLQKYPMALATLADLEEISPTSGRPLCATLYETAINSSKTFYNNMHVYPHVYYGAHLYRKGDFKTAIQCWADAADVIQNYSYSTQDEEIYKEFLEISKDYIGHIMKQSSTGISATSLTRDTNSFAQLLRFFDGICLWEESSKTLVVHIFWANTWIQTMEKFDSSVRKRLKILTSQQNDVEEYEENSQKSALESKQPFSDNNDDISTVNIRFRSSKMRGVADLLQRDKLDTGALKLHLTAQTLVMGNSIDQNAIQAGGIGGRTRKSQGGESCASSSASSPIKFAEVKRSRRH